METIVTIEDLNETSVNIKQVSIFTIEGKELETNLNRRALVNSEADRETLAGLDIPQNCKDAIMAMWGDKATISESIEE